MASHGGVHPGNPKPASPASVLEMLRAHTRPCDLLCGPRGWAAAAAAAAATPNLRTVEISGLTLQGLTLAVEILSFPNPNPLESIC